ncbi:hypothetical protein CRUP_030891, partial [Coryphaenoides rupestris]
TTTPTTRAEPSPSSTFVFYFKKCFYVAWMMCLALLAIPLCFLKSGGRDVENMRLIRSLVRHVKYFLGLRFDVSGWEHLQTEGPYVIISNHQSSLDVLGLMEILPDRCTMIAKKELVYAGTVGIVCWLGGIVFINRKKTSDAKSVMADAAKTMLDEQVLPKIDTKGLTSDDVSALLDKSFNAMRSVLLESPGSQAPVAQSNGTRGH